MSKFNKYLEEVRRVKQIEEDLIEEGLIGDVLMFPVRILLRPIKGIIEWILSKTLSTKEKIDLTANIARTFVKKNIELEELESSKEFELSPSDKKRLQKLREENPKQRFDVLKEQLIQMINQATTLSEKERDNALKYVKIALDYKKLESETRKEAWREGKMF